MANPAQQLVPRTFGLLAVAYGIWLLASPLLGTATEFGGWLYLVFPGLPGLAIVMIGVLLWFRNYRLLAKLGISVVAIALLAFLAKAPGLVGVDLRNLTPDRPWPIVASFAIAGLAIWVCQRFVVVADQTVDRRFDAPGMSNQPMQWTRDAARRRG